MPSVSTDKLAVEIEVFKAARAAAGLPKTDQIVRLFEVVCAPDEETVLKRAAPYLLVKYASYAQWGMPGVEANTEDS